MTGAVSIASGNSTCIIAPKCGGSISSWHLDGQPMLRAAMPGSLTNGNVLDSASFPLVPYSNRISDGRFSWRERTFELPRHKLSLPHAIHGIGWERNWSIAEHSKDTVLLRLQFSGDPNWPWPFLAEQEIQIGKKGLILNLSVTNLADESVPLSFGHHPYFDASGATLQFKARQFFPNTKNALPAEPITPTGIVNFSSVKLVTGAPIDNLYGGWDGFARIVWQGRFYALEIVSSLPHAVLYTPPDADYFCFEPVPHLTNALNRVDGDIPVIAPGERSVAQIEFQPVPTQNKETQS
jgi:aldose 1-epimerase